MTETKQRIYHVTGGVYETRGGTFCLCKPTGGKPYVYESETLAREAKLHSHHYQLSEDMKTVVLVTESGWIAGRVGAPTEATLSESDFQGVKERIEAGDIYYPHHRRGCSQRASSARYEGN